MVYSIPGRPHFEFTTTPLEISDQNAGLGEDISYQRKGDRKTEENMTYLGVCEFDTLKAYFLECIRDLLTIHK